MPMTSSPSSRASEAFWQVLHQLLRARWLIIAVTGFAAVASIVISLLLPNWYRAETRLLLAGRTSAGLLSGLLASQLSPTASSLLGGLVSDYQRQLTILNSRTLRDSVINKFDLINVYDLADAEFPLFEARKVLSENVDFVVDNEFNYLSLLVYDTDPQRAADMANFIAEELNRVTIQLASQTAGTFRQVAEELYDSVEENLDSVLTTLRDLQQRTGIMDLPTQGAAFMEGLIGLRMEIQLVEIDYNRLLYMYGEDNSQVRAAEQALLAAKETYENALDGQERLLPVAQDSLPDIALQFQELEKERVILTSLIEFTRPLLEQARLEEKQRNDTVQIVDPAIPPDKKARPWRAAIVVVSTMSGFLIAALYVLFLSWWRNNYAIIAARLSDDSVIT